MKNIRDKLDRIREKSERCGGIQKIRNTREKI